MYVCIKTVYLSNLFTLHLYFSILRDGHLVREFSCLHGNLAADKYEVSGLTCECANEWVQDPKPYKMAEVRESPLVNSNTPDLHPWHVDCSRCGRDGYRRQLHQYTISACLPCISYFWYMKQSQENPQWICETIQLLGGASWHIHEHNITPTHVSRACHQRGGKGEWRALHLDPCRCQSLLRLGRHQLIKKKIIRIIFPVYGRRVNLLVLV